MAKGCSALPEAWAAFRTLALPPTVITLMVGGGGSLPKSQEEPVQKLQELVLRRRLSTWSIARLLFLLKRLREREK